ncbi:phosphoglucomutase/phosphomannomutase, alpha/beta/alpha domain II [Trichuris suis]|nr:phosphoglucomutase/phosphomannomutase, alpha/beta/alpha domain II [Trichuris suis]
MSVGDAALDEQIRLWMEWDKNEKTRAEVEKLIKDNAIDELRARMIGRITFGTAGLRGTMGAGFKRINDLVILQSTQGLCDYLLTLKPNPESLSIAIGYDVRHNSRRFAELAGTVFLRKGVKVYFFSKYVPTPLVSYAVTFYKCDAGIMITASHNPKDDNGYKVYWGNGAQLVAPHDANVLKHIESNLTPWPQCWDTSILQTSSLCLDPLKEVCAQYLVDNSTFCFHRDANKSAAAKLTFSAFHGVGTAYVLPMLKQFGFNTANVVLVEEQAEPDPDFPTAPFPNPEEGEKVLKLSMRTADENNSKIVFCTDPDADRFQLVEKQPSGEWYIFSGNEMGTLLTWWLWQNRKCINDKLQSTLTNLVCNAYAVSTKFAKTMAEKEGFKYEETLTGFKWLANRAYELRNKGKVVLLAWEESIGYMPGASLDKDGVVTCAVFADFFTFLNNKKIKFTDQLENIYSNYGLHLCYNSYLRCPKPKCMVSLFDDLRKADPNKGYAAKCGEGQIKYVRDLGVGYDNSCPDNKPVLPWGPTNYMITYTLENGSTFTIRGSGTEPKVKFYIEIILPPNQSKDKVEAKRQLDDLIKVIISDFFQPEKHGLIMRSTKAVLFEAVATHSLLLSVTVPFFCILPTSECSTGKHSKVGVWQRIARFNKGIDDKLERQISLWLDWDKNEQTRQEIEELVKEGAFAELADRLATHVSFGISGIKAPMGAGFNRMNELVVIQITQGMCDYMLLVNPCPEGRSIAVGYDCRRNSLRFAQLAANIFLRKKFRVFFFSKAIPSPIMSYTVLRYNCDAGIMITGSHDSKFYNGYKVIYWRNGVEVSMPHDRNIMKHMQNNLNPWMDSWDISALERRELCVDPLDDISMRYQMESFDNCYHYDANLLSTEKITYSPLHGVGLNFVLGVLKEFGFSPGNIVIVKEQAEANPDFPTLEHPDPEEGEKAFKLSIQTAEDHGSNLIFCTDPGADRFCFAEKQPNGRWHIFSGNEIGTLLSWWLWTNWKSGKATTETNEVYILNTVGSSKFARTMAAKEGFKYEETLVGFKWLANRANNLRASKKAVLLAWEEALGYMPGIAMDSDGIITCAIFADFSTYLYRQSMSFCDQLEQIYATYGAHLGCTTFFSCSDNAHLAKIFGDLRRSSAGSLREYPGQCGELKVRHVRDLSTGYNSGEQGTKTATPWSPIYNVITYTLFDGSTFTIRQSGTEKRIKCNIEIILPPEKSKDVQAAKRQLENLKALVIKDFLKPDQNRLVMTDAK